MPAVLILSCALAAARADADPIPTVPAPPAGADTLATSQDRWATAELRARLDGSDRWAALQALHVALTQLSDGASYVWGRSTRRLVGVIKPTMTFRDREGRVCRHLIYTLSVGAYTRSVEGIACRQPDRLWTLSG